MAIKGRFQNGMFVFGSNRSPLTDDQKARRQARRDKAAVHMEEDRDGVLLLPEEMTDFRLF